MNLYLEGYLWPDVHNALASKIRQQLTPKLRPRYTARLEVYVVEDRCQLAPDSLSSAFVYLLDKGFWKSKLNP